jgi:hypothetical protein
MLPSRRLRKTLKCESARSRYAAVDADLLP